MFFLRFCLFWGVVLSFLPLLRDIEPRVSLFDAFALQFAVGNLCLVLVLFAFRHRLKSWRLWVVAGMAGSIWSTVTVWPEMTFRAQPASAGAALKVVNVNILDRSHDLGAVVDYLTTGGADVVGLVEVGPEAKARLASLKTLYPYSIDCIDLGPPCQAMLLSRLPLDRAFAGSIGGYATTAAQGEIHWQEHRIRITVIHIPPPSYASYPIASEPEVPPLPSGVPALWQSQQTAFLARDVALSQADGTEQIVLGDFNSVPWSPLQRAFRAATGLENRGTWAPSWPSWHPSIARIPIDPVFTGGALAIRRLEVGPDVGSDHRPIAAEISLVQE